MPTDPGLVGGVDGRGEQVKTEHEGRTYYFCTEACKIKFDPRPCKWPKRSEKVEITP